jgi:hypothetical protein
VLKPRYRRYVHLAALSLLLALPAAAPAAAAPRVTVIADSVGGVLEWDGESFTTLGHGFDLRVESAVCRRLVAPGCADPPAESAVDLVRRLGPELGKIVVVETGYNDPPKEVAAAIDPLMTALAGNGVEHVIWLTYVVRQSQWTESNAAVTEATTRWPQLVVADWNAFAFPHPEWFVDDAHIDTLGGRALAGFLRPFLLAACAEECVPPTVFCGLARTANGFDYVQAAAVACSAALGIVASVERGVTGPWVCSRSTNGTIELTCRTPDARIDVLERSPVAAHRVGATVRIANWIFRLGRRAIVARADGRRAWISLGASPWCIPDVPRDVLVAFRLRPSTPNGGCYSR